MPVRSLLACAVVMPVVYFATLIGAGVANPGVPVGAVPSMLGAAPAPYPGVYNGGMVLSAVSGILGAVGVGVQLPKIGAGRVLGIATATTIALSSLGLAEAGLFPLPSPYHEAFGLSLFGAFTPLLGAFALMRARDDRRAVAALFVAFAAVVLVFAILNGVGGFATDANAGVSVPVLAVPAFASLGFIGWRARIRT